MKRTPTILFCILFSTGMFLNKTNAQCLNQVSHTTGTQIVNGTSVTVTSFGTVDTNTVHCSGVTEPYFIGYNWTTGVSSDGSYRFQFSPAVESLTLNFSGVSYIPPNQEVVVLYSNGVHYSIPNIGNSNGCDALAVLTPSGNITGCLGCSVSGWSGTTIPGPLTSLTVLDSAITGFGNGAIFSLYICNSITTGVLENEPHKLNVFPNPADELITVKGIELKNAKLSMKNIFGQNIVIEPIHQFEQVLIDVSNLSSGIYFIVIESGEMFETRKVIIK